MDNENEEEEEPSASGAILNFGTKTKKGGGENDDVTCSLEDGLACRAAEGGQCQDYEYRVKCECELRIFFWNYFL